MISVQFNTTSNIWKKNQKCLLQGYTHMECDANHSIIEKAKKHTYLKINNPNNWAMLMRIVIIKQTFSIVVMKSENFFDF
ncbi:hypothetical protein PR048_013367, partial [Dryococelus australis]